MRLIDADELLKKRFGSCEHFITLKDAFKGEIK